MTLLTVNILKLSCKHGRGDKMKKPKNTDAWDVAYAEYHKIKQLARAEYEKIRQPALAEYEKIRDAALEKYKKIEQPAYAKYSEIEQPALAKYNEIEPAAWEACEKAKGDRGAGVR